MAAMSKHPEEEAAAAAVRGVTGAETQHYDRDGRQGAVDFLIRYPSGRTGALEVTSHAGPGSRELTALLRKTGFRWDNPGQWTWSIAFDIDADLKQVRGVYRYVIETCEAHHVTTPEQLPDDVLMFDDILFAAAFDLGVRFYGNPGKAAGRGVTVMPSSVGGGVDEDLIHLPDVCSELLEVTHIAEHVAKVLRHPADEHHLFVWVGPGGIPFPQYYVLCGIPTRLPSTPPRRLQGLSNLWLATGWGPSLIAWDAHGGWQAHTAFDTQPPPDLAER